MSGLEPFEFCTGITPGIPYSRIEYALPQESQTINMGLEFWNMSIEESEEFTYYFTITTP